MGKIHTKKTHQISCTIFLTKYCGLHLYDGDLNNRYTIDNEDIHLINNYGHDSIGNTDETDGTLTDHEYFSIRDNFSDSISSTNQNEDILSKITPPKVSSPIINKSNNLMSNKSRKKSNIISPRHTFQRKIQKKSMIIQINILMI